MQVVDRYRYRYLGIVLNEFLDFSVTARVIADAAHRALGLLIAKVKFQGGMPYQVFTKLQCVGAIHYRLRCGHMGLQGVF